MKANNLRLLPMALLAIGLVFGYAPAGYAAHTGGVVELRDAAGAVISAGSTTPYSPKKTCSTDTCHVGAYESSPAQVLKDHGPDTDSYTVWAPQHGVSAGYHFQQGRNIAWNEANDNAQRSFYGLPKFTSSPGMYGKY